MGQMTTFNINPLHRIIAQAGPLVNVAVRESPRNPRMTYTYYAGNQLTNRSRPAPHNTRPFAFRLPYHAR